MIDITQDLLMICVLSSAGIVLASLLILLELKIKRDTLGEQDE